VDEFPRPVEGIQKVAKGSIGHYAVFRLK